MKHDDKVDADERLARLVMTASDGDRLYVPVADVRTLNRRSQGGTRIILADGRQIFVSATSAQVDAAMKSAS